MAKVNVLIVYDSRTGNTEKMALAVAEGVRSVKGVSAVVKKVDDAKIQDMMEAHAIILGSPTYYGTMTYKIKKFLDESVKRHGKLEGKVGAAFTSAGSTATGAETAILSMIQGLLIHGMIVQGRSEEKHYGAFCVGAPDKEGKKHCIELGKRTAALAKKLFG